MRRFLIVLVSVFALQTASAFAGAPGSMVTDKAQYVPGETVAFTLDNWCSPTDIPFIAVFDSGNTMIAQITDAVESGGTVTANFVAPATLGVYTAKTQAQSCPERTVGFAVVATSTTTTVPTTLPVTTTTINAVLPGTGGPTWSMLVPAFAVLLAGVAVVASVRRRERRPRRVN